MKRDVLITVTADHIKAGKPGSSGRCPLSLALADALGPYPEIIVTAGVAWSPWRWMVEPLPAEARAFAAAFDRRETCRPFKFTMAIEESAITGPSLDTGNGGSWRTAGLRR